MKNKKEKKLHPCDNPDFIMAILPGIIAGQFTEEDREFHKKQKEQHDIVRDKLK